jgi:hypothetical protein
LFSRLPAHADTSSDSKRANSITTSGGAGLEETASVLSTGNDSDGISSTPRHDNAVAPFATILASLHAQLPELLHLLVEPSRGREEADRLDAYVQDAQSLFQLASQCGGDMKALYQNAVPLIQYWNFLRSQASAQKNLILPAYKTGVWTHCEDAEEREASHQKLFQAVAKTLHQDKDHLFPGLEDIVSSWKAISEFQFSEFRFLGDEKPFLYIYCRLIGGRSRLITVHYDSEDPDKIVFAEDEKVSARGVKQRFDELSAILVAPIVNRKTSTEPTEDLSDASDEEESPDADLHAEEVEPEQPED